MLKIQVINKGHQPLPQYATPQSAGMDLRANLEEPIILRPLERRFSQAAQRRHGKVGRWDSKPTLIM